MFVARVIAKNAAIHLERENTPVSGETRLKFVITPVPVTVQELQGRNVDIRTECTSGSTGYQKKHRKPRATVRVSKGDGSVYETVCVSDQVLKFKDHVIVCHTDSIVPLTMVARMYIRKAG